ncbi:PHP domain-containing protein [Nocardioides piscis]|uniref:PHP domain-containing protein n=1 Tax=Nocardioides piscis TaxID=2714938 RepID=A0A6G7YGA5_9ACTN|nr:PHP domain-containing protein [Nocardioides piscis]QIK75637.1 PHP domain-containing protein [Nocardioides piscis]
MRIDLHTHSSVSDGTDTPADLVRAAKAAGLDVVALTDHDTARGWAEAQRTAEEVGIGFVPGIEISTRLGSASVHLLAYLLDPTHPPLVTALDAILDGRNSRLPAVCSKLQGLGLAVTEEDVHRVSGDAAATGRPHIADAMVAAGFVASREEAFATYLNPGRPAYVKRYACPLDEAVSLVVAAGGVPVIAHAWGRSVGVITEEEVARLADLGLRGIEVDHQEHSPRERDALRAIARDLDLIVTGSSDHHGLGKVDHDLGCNTTDPAELERILSEATSVPSTGSAGRAASG